MTVYSDKALKNIIIENGDDERIVRVASSLCSGWVSCKDRDKLETELTGLLLNKQYES